MKVKGYNKEAITVEINEVGVLDSLIRDYRASYLPHEDAYMGSDGYWYYDEDMRGRGSDIVTKLRKATKEEISAEQELRKFSNWLEERQ